MREPSQFSESLINSSKPSASKKFVSIHGGYHLAGRDSIIDGDLSDCEKLLADPVNYGGRLSPALKYDKVTGDYSGVIDVGILYPSANISRDDNYDHEIWLLKSDGIYLQRGPDKYLFADYSISESPLRIIQADSQTLYVVFEEPGHNYKLSYNYWREEWMFGVAVPNHISFGKNYGIKKQSQLSDSINDPGSLSFHCNFDRISNSAVKFSSIDFNHDNKDQYEQVAEDFWYEVMSKVMYATNQTKGDSGSSNIDTAGLVNDVKGILEDNNLLDAVDGFSNIYTNDYDIPYQMNGPFFPKNYDEIGFYFKQEYDTNRNLVSYDYWSGNMNFSPKLKASDGDVESFICWLIGFTHFARPKTGGPTPSDQFKDFRYKDRESWGKWGRIKVNTMSKLRDGSQGGTKTSLDDIVIHKYSHILEDLYPPFATETIAYSKLKKDSQSLSQFEEFETKGVRVSYGWILSGGQFANHGKRMEFKDSIGVAGWVSVAKDDVPNNVEGIALYQSINKGGSWSAWKLINQFSLSQIKNDKPHYSVDLAYYRDKDMTDKEFAGQDIRYGKINSALIGGVYFMPIVCEQRDGVTFGELAGYSGPLMKRWGHLQPTGEVIVATNIGRSDFRSDQHLVVSAISQSGVNQQDLFAEIRAHQIPDLSGGEIYKLFSIDRYLFIVCENIISIYRVSGRSVNHLRTVYGACPVSKKACATDGKYLYSITNEGLKVIDAGGNKQKIFKSITWENIDNPFIYFDSPNNEIVVHGDDVCYVANLKTGLVYQRGYSGGPPDKMFRLRGISNLISGSDIYEYTKTKSGKISMLTRPFYFGVPASRKRMRDLLITFRIDKDIASETKVFNIYLKSEKSDLVLSEDLNLKDYTAGTPLTARFQIHRITQEKVSPSKAVWELTPTSDNNYWQLSVNAANAPSRWYQLGIESDMDSDKHLRIDSIDIGYSVISYE